MYTNRIQDLLSKEARLITVETLVLSHINNGITIWSTANITQLKRVNKLQSFAVKVAIGEAFKFDHANPILNKLQWLPIRQSHLRAMPNIVQDNEQSAPSLVLLLPTSQKCKQHQLS